MNQRYVLTTVKLKDLLSHKVQTQNLLFTFTWNVKRPQNNFVPIIHECDLYSSKYGMLFSCIIVIDMLKTILLTNHDNNHNANLRTELAVWLHLIFVNNFTCFPVFSTNGADRQLFYVMIW